MKTHRGADDPSTTADVEEAREDGYRRAIRDLESNAQATVEPDTLKMMRDMMNGPTYG